MIAPAGILALVALALFGRALRLAWVGQPSRSIGAFHLCGALLIAAFFVAGLS